MKFVSIRASQQLVTLWYRAPEVLLGQKQYSTSIDMWSIGCIFAEMATKKPIFSGDSEIGQIFKIFQIQGTPTEETWPGISSLPDFKATFPKFKRCSIADSVPDLDIFGLDLLTHMICMDPTKRLTAKAALKHVSFEN